MGGSFELRFEGVKIPTLKSCHFTSACESVRVSSTEGADFSWDQESKGVLAMRVCVVACKAWSESDQSSETFRFQGPPHSAADTLLSVIYKERFLKWPERVFGAHKIQTGKLSYLSKFFNRIRPRKSQNRKSIEKL